MSLVDHQKVNVIWLQLRQQRLRVFGTPERLKIRDNEMLVKELLAATLAYRVLGHAARKAARDVTVPKHVGVQTTPAAVGCEELVAGDPGLLEIAPQQRGQVVHIGQLPSHDGENEVVLSDRALQFLVSAQGCCDARIEGEHAGMVRFVRFDAHCAVLQVQLSPAQACEIAATKACDSVDGNCHKLTRGLLASQAAFSVVSTTSRNPGLGQPGRAFGCLVPNRRLPNLLRTPRSFRC